MRFVHEQIGPGLNVYALAPGRFKEVSVAVHLHRPLTRETVTRTALVPYILQRGTKTYPSTLELTRHLDNLFGAGLSVGVERHAALQTLTFDLSVVDDRFLPAASMDQAMATLVQVLLDPALEGQQFRPEVVEQEKLSLRRRIEGLYNDKARWAVVRCLELMYQDAPYGLYPYGRADDVAVISGRQLTDTWRELLAHAPVDVLMVGGDDPGQLLALARRHLHWERGPVWELTRQKPGPVGGKAKAVRERQPINQGKLTLGYRTGVTASDPDYFAVTVMNGILGGFVHSKLFRNVREKASLAYTVNSRLDSLTGTLLITAGIDPKKYDQALGIIQEQVQALQQGEVSAQELAFTRDALRNRFLAALDSPGGLIAGELQGILAGRRLSVEETVAGVESVQAADVIRAAGLLQLDTIYFLEGEEGGNG